jgi:hypothetical protein
MVFREVPRSKPLWGGEFWSDGAYIRTVVMYGGYNSQVCRKTRNHRGEGRLYADEFARICLITNGANMPHYSQRGALFDFVTTCV